MEKALFPLQKRADFLRLSRTGQKVITSSLVLLSTPTPLKFLSQDSPLKRVGFTVTKKIGKAVIRNRAKRRLREAARQALPLYGQNAYDYVIIARSGSLLNPFQKIQSDLKMALKKIHHEKLDKNK